jgi:UDP-2,3-diacylglucosamine hydrolase
MHNLDSSQLRMVETAQSNPVALFVSDVHLHSLLPRTTQAFLDFLSGPAVRARQLYLLGDLFEYWAGDDDIPAPYNKTIVDAIRRVVDSGAAVFWIGGNRDFLVGAGFAQATGATLLPDPFVATMAGLRVALAHGDAQCTDDVGYVAFRSQVRAPAWQAAFLAQPLAKRKAIIEGLRTESREAQRGKSYDVMDVNDTAIRSLFDTTGASVLIHGHTHRPAVHDYQSSEGRRTRYVLPDWECDVEPPRGGWLELDSDACIHQRELTDIYR